MKRIIVALAALLLASPAHAAGVTLGKPAYGGTGCPAGTASASVGGGGKTVTVRFSRYAAAAGNGRSFDRKSCNLAIPLKVPAGVSVSLVSLQFSGFNSLPAGAKAEFSTEYFLAGGRGPTFSRAFTGPKQGTFKTTDTGKATTWSACGADVILRTNSSLKVTTANNRAALSAIDAQRVKSALVFQLKTRAC